MTEELWTDVDSYLSDQLVPHDHALEAALSDSKEAGLPEISVSRTQGKFLHLMARMVNSRVILEIGTLGGYSTIWLGRALQAGGRLITLELDEHHAEVAARNIDRAGLTDTVDIRVGNALESIPVIASEGLPPLDFTFIDADKARIPEYFDWAVKLTRPGGVIVVDNVVRNGAVIDSDSEDPNVLGVRRFHDQIASDRRVAATTMQTVGSKGYDGFTIAIVEQGE